MTSFPAEWREAMLGDTDQARVLENLEADNCVYQSLVEELVSGLSDQFVDDQSWDKQARAGAAAAALRQVVRGTEESCLKYLCQGKEVPKGKFERLIRFDKSKNWSHRFPTADDPRLNALRAMGIDKRQPLSRLNEEQQVALTRELEAAEVLVGHPRKCPIVWLADADDVQWTAGNTSRTLDRLGLDMGPSVHDVMITQLNRDELAKSLHVPRALDATDNPLFQVNTDCDANSGFTRPIGKAAEDGESGLPEAVTRNFVAAVRVEFDRI